MVFQRKGDQGKKEHRGIRKHCNNAAQCRDNIFLYFLEISEFNRFNQLCDGEDKTGC